MAYDVVTSHMKFSRKSNIDVRLQFDMVDGSSIEYLGFALYDGALDVEMSIVSPNGIYGIWYILLLFIAVNVKD